MDVSALTASMATPQFWVAVVQIIWINILLSGDNAVVIALACRELPPRERLWGMVIGAGIASILLIAFTAVASVLLRLPYLQLVGSLLLMWIAVKLLSPQAHDEEGSPEAAKDLWRAVWLVVIADLIMSLDNVIAVASVAKGEYVFLIIGLAISIPIVIAGSAVILWLMERFPILVWGGAAILGWVAGGMFITDPVLKSILPHYIDATVALNFDIKSMAFGWDGTPSFSFDLVELGASALIALLVLVIGAFWSMISAETVSREQVHLADHELPAE
jgi:YjbE family integral membrane protein